ncbi:MAG: histidine phosphatase family protein [Bacillota bacterium]
MMGPWASSFWSATAGPPPVYCSPLARAAETARIVAQCLTREGFHGDFDVHVDQRFTDINVGSWTGLSLSLAEARDPGLYDSWVKFPHTVRFPGGQTLGEVQDAAWSGVLSLVPLLEVTDVILVSHRLTLKTVILRAIGAGLQHFWQIRLDTASISILETGGYGTSAQGGGPFTLSRLNDVSHLASLRLPDRADF